MFEDNGVFTPCHSDMKCTEGVNSLVTCFFFHIYSYNLCISLGTAYYPVYTFHYSLHHTLHHIFHYYLIFHSFPLQFDFTSHFTSHFASLLLLGKCTFLVSFFLFLPYSLTFSLEHSSYLLLYLQFVILLFLSFFSISLSC